MALGIVFLALGLMFIYIEFFMPHSVMTMGGIILMLCSFAILFLQKINFLYLIAFVIISLLLLLFVIQLAFWKIKRARINIFFYNNDYPDEKIHNEQLVGRKAIAATDISPSGKILIDGTYFSAFSHKGAIKKGKAVEVIGGEETHLIISPLTPNVEV